MMNIKAVFKCSEQDKLKFCESHCLLTISVGQEVHENEKFEATIKLVNNSFKQCTILVDDTLQRHSLRLTLPISDELAYEKCKNEGSSWIARNEHILKNLTIPFKLTRWDKWLKHNNFKKQKNIIHNLYLNNIEFSSQLDATIDFFLTRFTRRLENGVVVQKTAKQLCLEYVEEECAALCLWAENNYHYEVYPSKRSQAMSATYDIFIKPNYSLLLKPIVIKFKGRKQLKPQIFNQSVLEN